jgi:hypothetical protein
MARLLICGLSAAAFVFGPLAFLLDALPFGVLLPSCLARSSNTRCVTPRTSPGMRILGLPGATTRTGTTLTGTRLTCWPPDTQVRSGA